MMVNVKPYKLLYGRHSRVEEGSRVLYRPGSVIMLTETEAGKLEGKIEPAGHEQAPEEQPEPEEKQHVIQHVGGGWYELPGGKRVQGKENAAKELAAMLEEQ